MLMDISSAPDPNQNHIENLFIQVEIMSLEREKGKTAKLETKKIRK